MVCDKCRYVNKDTAEVCKHCGAPLRELPQTAAEYKPRAAAAGSINSAPRAVKVEVHSARKNSSVNESPKSVKTVNFGKPRETAADAAREYNIEAQDEFEADSAREDGRRDNIKFIAIIASLVVFVIGAVIVFALLLLGKPGAAASGDAAPSSSAISATAESPSVSSPAAAGSPTT